MIDVSCQLCAYFRERRHLSRDESEIAEAQEYTTENLLKYDRRGNIRPVELATYDCEIGAEFLDPGDLWQARQCESFTTMILPSPYMVLNSYDSCLWDSNLWLERQYRKWAKVLGWPQEQRQ